MNRTPNILETILSFLFIVQFSATAQVSIFSIDELHTAITDHSLSMDFILIDVRDSNTVGNGIVASIYCKPYNLSWNDSVFHRAIGTIPSDIPVMIYDQTGTFAMQAARMLADSGHEVVAAIAGGVNAYQGTLADISYLNPPELLPQPSYFGDLSGTVRRLPTPPAQTVMTSNHTFRGTTTVFPNGRTSPRQNARQSAAGCIITRKQRAVRKTIYGLQ